MNGIVMAMIRRALKPAVTVDEPGQMVLVFSMYHMLPKEAIPHLRLIEQALALLPGVKSAAISMENGELEIRYDAATLSSEQVRGWLNAVIDECVRYLGGIRPGHDDLSEQAVASALMPAIRERLTSWQG